MEESLALMIVGAVCTLMGIVMNINPIKFDEDLLGALEGELSERENMLRNFGAQLRCAIGALAIAIGIIAIYNRDLAESDAEKLLVRQTSGYDGVEPSGNSNAALAFLKLSAYLIDPELTKKAEKIFLSFSDELMEYGLNSAFMLQALHLYLGGLKEVAIIGKKNDKGEMFNIFLKDEIDTKSSQIIYAKKGVLTSVFAFSYDDEIEKNAKIIPLLEGRKLHQGKAVAYVCHQGTCLPPVQTSEELVKLLSYE